MKKFIYKTFLFTSVLMFFLLSIDFITSSGLQKTQYGEFKEWNEIYSGNINADLIINGSSRAWVHISPKIIDSVLSTNSYNFGIDGHNFDMQICKYEEYLKHNDKPDAIIQILDVFTLQKRKDLYGYEQFLPYLYKCNIRQHTAKYVGFSYADYYIPLYRYLHNKFFLEMGLKEFFGNSFPANKKYKGYRGMDRKWDNSFDKYKKKHPEGTYRKLDNETIEEFDEFLKKCKKNNTIIYLIYPPEYIEGQKMTKNRDSIISLYSDFAKKYGFTFLNYSQDSLSFQRKMFYNSQHLNRKGAEIFSEKLANDIKKLQKK